MNYEIVTTDTFRREFKALSKKYRSLPNDLAAFKKKLLQNPEIGDDLGNNIRKVRMAIASKNKGKSGGARIITYTVLVDVINTDIYLLAIYDKSKQDSISHQEIKQLQQKNGLL
jgi:mRNA-degrading endonuclease RelE of RelBE toxin-antitoxin system